MFWGMGGGREGGREMEWEGGGGGVGVGSLDSDLPLWCPGGQGAAGESVQFPPSFAWPQVSSVLS